MSGSLEASARATNTLVIPGIEVSALDGPHILVYFYEAGDLVEFYRRSVGKRKKKSPYLAIRASTSEILDWTSAYACLSCAAHPYGYLLFNKGIGRCVSGGYLPEALIRRFDAVEVISAGMTRVHMSSPIGKTDWERQKPGRILAQTSLRDSEAVKKS